MDPVGIADNVTNPAQLNPVSHVASLGPTTLRVAAVVTAFHPPPELLFTVAQAARACNTVIVVDNTPAGVPSLAEGIPVGQGVLVRRPGRNLGLAGALNLGVSLLPEGLDAVIFLDQDTVLPPDVLPALIARFAAATDIGILGPRPVNRETGGNYARSGRVLRGLHPCDTVITSGMLVRRSHLGPDALVFREDFHVDWVDNDFCLRARLAGVRIALDHDVELPHSIGTGRLHRIFGRDVRVLHYPAWRHYWIARNGALLARELGYRFPGWAVQCGLYMGRQFLTTLVFADTNGERVAWFRGVRDGLTGKVAARYDRF